MRLGAGLNPDVEAAIKTGIPYCPELARQRVDQIQELDYHALRGFVLIVQLEPGRAASLLNRVPENRHLCQPVLKERIEHFVRDDFQVDVEEMRSLARHAPSE